jgi:hypothetical protein
MSTNPSAYLVTLLSMATLACSDPLSPQNVKGSYALLRVAGDTLPALLYTNDYVSVRILSETLRFTTDDRGSRTVSYESTPLAGGFPTVANNGLETRAPENFHWRVRNGRLEITYDCPINANCIAGPHLLLLPTTNGLLGYPRSLSRSPLLYERLPLGS